MHSPAIRLPLDYALRSECEVVIQPGAAADLGTWLQASIADRAVLLVSDTNVDRIYGSSLMAQLQGAARNVTSHILPPGESTKSLASAAKLWDAMAAAALDRHALVVVLGGGVVGDLAGFAAATYGRGLDWIQIPTTLVAQVDSSLGGKVGINLDSGKNLVGCVWQPQQVVIDPNLLRTLPPREYRSGLAEVAKYAVMVGDPLFARMHRDADRLRDGAADVLLPIISDCCRCKLELVQRDPLDRAGVRAVLNYGHTFGHAIENVLGYGTWTHGEAVACGMSLAARLARRIGWVDGAFVDAQDDLLRRLGLPTRADDLPTQAMLQAMSRDKKALGGRIRFVLPRRLGDIALCDEVSQQDVTAVLSECAGGT